MKNHKKMERIEMMNNGTKNKDVIDIIDGDMKLNVEFDILLKDLIRLRAGESVTVPIKGVPIKLVPPNYQVHAVERKKPGRLSFDDAIMLGKNEIDASGVTTKKALAHRFEVEGYEHATASTKAKEVMLELQKEGYIVEGEKQRMVIRPPE